jgi:F-type H+-transporting ATPase subunit gamma
MPSLKDLKIRIGSVKSTQKITSAMKLVAASKLRRAQEQAEASQPYATAMERMIKNLAGGVDAANSGSKLLAGTGRAERHLLVLVTADRGLCGSFNPSIFRFARNKVAALEQAGKIVTFVTVGRKGRDALRRTYPAERIVESYTDIGRRAVQFAEAQVIADKVLSLYEQGTYDVCSMIFAQFHNIMRQDPVAQQLVPTPLPPAEEASATELKAQYTFEPSEAEILDVLLPRNVAVQIYKALLDSAAGEQAARMTAMDNATRNAGDMIKNLTLQYNRSRQAAITKELIEIISGAEAL